LQDVFRLESEGLPVAYVDTAGRVPRVTREGRVFVIEYAALKYAVSDARRWPPETPEGKRRLLRTFENFGLHRALRLAGAEPGAPVRLGDFEVERWEPPEPAKGLAIEGVAEYDYVVARPPARLSPPELREEAARVAPLLLAKLTVR
jgi:hypothetical protein